MGIKSLNLDWIVTMPEKHQCTTCDSSSLLMMNKTHSNNSIISMEGGEANLIESAASGSSGNVMHKTNSNNSVISMEGGESNVIEKLVSGSSGNEKKGCQLCYLLKLSPEIYKNRNKYVTRH